MSFMTGQEAPIREWDNLTLRFLNNAKSKVLGDWVELQNRLQGNFEVITFMGNRGKRINFNRNGDALENPLEPKGVANLVFNGDVWIDWCCTPFRQNERFANIGTDEKNDGFAEFLNGMGVNAVGPTGLGPPEFQIPPFSPIRPFDFPCSLMTHTNMENFRGNPTFIINPNTPRRSGPGVDAHIYSSFAFRWGQGLYCYAFGDEFSGVTVDQYFPFIRDQILGLVVPGPALPAGFIPAEGWEQVPTPTVPGVTPLPGSAPGGQPGVSITPVPGATISPPAPGQPEGGVFRLPRGLGGPALLVGGALLVGAFLFIQQQQRPPGPTRKPRTTNGVG